MVIKNVISIDIFQVLTLLNYFINEYSPASWKGMHIFTWILNCFGMFFILAAHEHYSIDVFVAFCIFLFFLFPFSILTKDRHIIEIVFILPLSSPTWR